MFKACIWNYHVTILRLLKEIHKRKSHTGKIKINFYK